MTNTEKSYCVFGIMVLFIMMGGVFATLNFTALAACSIGASAALFFLGILMYLSHE